MPELSRKKYEALLHEAGCSNKVIAHCRAVTDCALSYARQNPEIDSTLVETGAMLHDIGRGITHSIAHAQAGADLLRSRGFPEEVARIVECHTGAGLTADECTLLGLAPRDCMPRTPEEKIVTHADNLIAGTRRMTIDESIAAAIHLPKKARNRMYELSCEVELLCNHAGKKAGPIK
jgi:uncharacterized protein